MDHSCRRQRELPSNGEGDRDGDDAMGKAAWFMMAAAHDAPAAVDGFFRKG